ncbi:MAG TPA: FAD-dependent oxidoreductase, partial [Deltaproteobacteria bacterium]|nr:FAD-dependent oxidoreductase [Deltaproteobacteria bacterium]
MKPEIFWTEQYPPNAGLKTSLKLPETTENLIIGSGYTGLSTARVLSKAGEGVTVLDQNCIGWGASSRNGGMATPGLKQDIYKIYKKYGIDYAQEFWKASLDAIDLLEEIITEEKIECDWSRDGHIALACKQSHYNKLPDYANWIQQELGHTKKIVPKEEIHSEIGSDFYFGGLSDEVSGGLHPSKFVNGLATSLISLGVILCENTKVISIKKLGSYYEVIKPKGTI